MTTVLRRPLQTPSVDSTRFAVGRTSRASDAQLLIDLANDAAGGHPGQRATVPRSIGGKYTLFYDPRTSARILELALTVSWNGTWSPGDAVTLDVSITDGATTVLSSNAAIPWGLKGDQHYVPGGSAGRFNSMTRSVRHLDRDALVTAGLSASAIWVFQVTVTCATTVYLEGLELSEMSRFAVDSQDDPRLYQPRGAITDTLQRLTGALETAYDLNRRTYHHFALAEGFPLTVTSATYAAIPNFGTGLYQSESAGVPTPWVVPPRRIRGTPALEFGVHYATSGASAGYVQLTTGVGSYALTLPATSGTWANATVSLGFLADAATDTLYWEAKVDGGTSLFLATFWVADSPA